MIDETEYKIARQWRLTGGAGVPPEQVSPPSQRSLQVTRRSSHKQKEHTNGHTGRNEDEWSSETDVENEQHGPRSGGLKRSEVASMSRRREQLRMMLSTADITAVERAIDEHAGHADAELQELRRQLIQHREVSEYLCITCGSFPFEYTA